MVSAQPDSTGFISEAYVEAKGVVVKNMRFDSVVARVSGLQLNPTSEWQNGDNIKLQSLKSALVTVNLLESDINNALKGQSISVRDGDYTNLKKFSLHDTSVDITADGIKLIGLVNEVSTSVLNSYVAAWLLGAAATDYPIEINSKLRISTDGKELWLDNPTVTSNYTAINSYVEKNITRRTKPLLNLNETLKDVQITLGSVELKDGSITLSTKELPTALTSGTTYTYPRSSSNNNGTNTNNNTTNNNNTTTNESIQNTQPVMQNTFRPLSNTAVFSSDDVKSAINAKLGTLARTFPFKTTGVTSSGTKSITNAQLNSALGSTTWSDATTFPTQTVTEAGTYPLGTISLTAGTQIKLYMLVANGSGFSLADLSSVNFKTAGTVSDNAFFMDTDGNIISEVPASGTVIAVAPMEAGVEYTPVITTSSSGSKTPLGSSGNGCVVGVGAMAFATLALAFFKKH